jgi:hypothetical protein
MAHLNLRVAPFANGINAPGAGSSVIEHNPKLGVRQVAAGFFPGLDKKRGDDLLRWLDRCGYAVVEKEHGEAILIPEEAHADS